MLSNREAIKQKLDDIKDLKNLLINIKDRPTYDDLVLEMTQEHLKGILSSVNILEEELSLYLEREIE